MAFLLLGEPFFTTAKMTPHYFQVVYPNQSWVQFCVKGYEISFKLYYSSSRCGMKCECYGLRVLGFGPDRRIGIYNIVPGVVPLRLSDAMT